MRRRRRRRRTVVALAVVTVGAVVAAVVTGAVGRTAGRPDAVVASTPTVARAVTTTTPPTTTTTVPPTTTTTTDPGALPQTDALPPADGAELQTEMGALWQGVVSGSVTPALPSFFPESAYLQLKSIADAGGDYQGRLVADFAADVADAHILLGADPGTASLETVDVPESYAHWVPPGVCDNTLGYYEVANARVVYQQDGQTRSFGIASLISWRGVWYVVHLGAILRSTDGGAVDDPELGPGTAEPSSTC